MQIADEDFVSKVGCDIEHFLKKRHCNGILLFPPVNNYRRFLIHQTCENFCKQYDLCTFSVGQGIHRRTVICFRNQLLDPNKFADRTLTTQERKQSPVKSWRSERNNSQSDTQRNSKMGVEKNSDKTRLNKSHSVDLYIPPALRNFELNEGPYRNATATCATISNNTYSTSTTSSPISTNNSPIHLNENSSFDNSVTSKCIVSPKTTLTTAPTTATTTTAPIAQNVENGEQRQKQARRERRPDRVIYVPRARRSQTTPPTTQSQATTTTTATANTTEVTAATTATSSASKQLAIISNSTTSVSAVTSTKADGVDGGIGVSVSTSSKKLKTNISQKERKERKRTTNTVQNKTTNIVDNCSPQTGSIIPAQSGTDNFDVIYFNNCDSVQQQTQPQSPVEGNTHLQIINNFQKQSPKNFDSYDYLHNSENICTQLNDTNEMKSSKKRTKNQRTSKMEAVDKPNLLIEDVATNETSRTLPKCDIDEQELQRASKEINRSNRRIIKQSFVSDVLEIPERIEQNGTENENTNVKTGKSTDVSSNTEEEEDDWETMFDESGECLDPKIIEELTASVGKVKIELPKMDYNTYLSKQTILNEEEFPHVLEVSNFPVEFKNQDLLMLFSQYKESGFDIKWVDDTHALAVFSSSRIAAEVLSMRHSFVVLKPLAEATAESRLKAKKCATSLQPYRPRPETCAALARRLVTGALGVRLKTAAAERENEKRVLREAKERKLLAAKQRDEAWDN